MRIAADIESSPREKVFGFCILYCLPTHGSYWFVTASTISLLNGYVASI